MTKTKNGVTPRRTYPHFMITFTAAALVAWGTAQAQAEGEASDLARAVQNPVASLISVPFQNNTNMGWGADEEIRNVLNIQPIIPLKLSEDWTLITRTIASVVSQPAFAPGGSRKTGLGDTTFTAFLSPTDSGKVIWGAGPVLLMPTATDNILGSDQWGLGPSIVVLTMPGSWVIGSLFSNVWSVGGSGDTDVNLFTWQYFVNYNMQGGWYLTSSPIIKLGGIGGRVDDSTRRRHRTRVPRRQAGDERAGPGIL